MSKIASTRSRPSSIAPPPPLRAPEHTSRPAVGRFPAREAPEFQEIPSAAQFAAQPRQIHPHCSPVSLLWLAESEIGFTTQGNFTRATTSAKSFCTANEKKSGTRTPAARSISRCHNLLRQISTAAGGFPAIPSASAAYAAVTVGRSPSAISASIAFSPAAASPKTLAISCAASCGFSNAALAHHHPKDHQADGSGRFQTALRLPASSPPPQIRESDNQACSPVSARVSGVFGWSVLCYLRH